MKRDWIEKIHDSLCVILNHLLFVAAAITVSDLFQANSPNFFLWMVLVLIPAGVFYLTKRIPKLIPAPAFIILLGIMSLAEKIMTTHDWSIYYYVIAFAYFIGFFLYYFTKRFLDFLRLNQNTASNIPIQDIFKNGIGLTALFAVCSTIILLMSMSYDWMKVIADKIWGVIWTILRYLLGGIETQPPMEELEEQIQGGTQTDGSGMSEVVPVLPLEGLRDFILVLFIITIVIGFCLFAYYIYFVIKDKEGAQKRQKKNEKLEENGDVREYCGVEKKNQRKAGSFFFRTNREKIRRLYQKKISKRKKELIGEQGNQMLRYLTAKECCDKLAEQQLKLVYEKARYSEEEISAEDVRLAK